jgi:predicted GNAT family acetyltransferase
MEGDVPLAMTSLHADLPRIMQVGGVYTPPDLRNKGHARRAVGLHLAQARAAGVGQATLFAAGPAAVRAYQALGFRRVGLWTLCLFAKAVTVACP